MTIKKVNTNPPYYQLRPSYTQCHYCKLSINQDDVMDDGDDGYRYHKGCIDMFNEEEEEEEEGDKK